MTDEIPHPGTPEYRWWHAGALAEAAAHEQGRSAAGLEVRDFVDAVAENKNMQHMDKADIAAFAFRVFLAGVPLRKRLRLAWRAARRG